jgi:methylmalonyl-CoA mutase, N-terminal domain
MYRGGCGRCGSTPASARPPETNRRYRYLLDHGQTGLSVAFDLPTQMGYDADAPMAAGEVGRVGVSISSLDDMRTLLRRDSARGRVRVDDDQRDGGDPAGVLRRARGRARCAAFTLSGTIQNDMLKEYIARGTYIYPVEPSLRLVTDTFAFCADEVPRWNPISISGYHIREAGSTAVQEIAFTFANAMEYVGAPARRGWTSSAFAPGG